MPWVGLLSVVVKYPGHTHLLFNKMESAISTFVDGDQFFKVIFYKQTKTVQIRLCINTL